MPDRRLGVVIAADVVGFIRGLRDAGTATKQLGVNIDELSVSTKANADAQVAATVKKTARLRDEVTAYRAVAAAAEAGSDEQVAATNLAIRAQSRLADSLGVTAAEARRLSVSSAGVGNDIDRAGRGALAGAGAFSSLGRNIAFASTWFLGGVGFISGAKGAVAAASSLDEEMQRTSAVFGTAASSVKSWSTTSVQAMGISQAAALDASDTIGTLLQNVGETPAAGAAMSKTFVQLASDMAAFKKVDPNVALNALEAGLAGRTKSLKNFGLVIDATTIKAEALSQGILKSSVDPAKVADLQNKVSLDAAKVNVATTTHGAGSAQAVQATLQLHSAQTELAKAIGGTTGQLTAQQRTLAIYDLILKQTADQRGAFAADSDELTIKEEKFHGALTDTEAAIGNALLPTVSKYVGELGTWLSSTQNQAKVQKDVTAAVNDGVTILHVGADALRVITTLTGGFKNALELLLVLKLANSIAGWTTSLANYGTAVKVAAAETTASAAVIETDTAAIGTASVVAAGEVGGLRAALLGIGAPEVLAAIGLTYAALYGAKELGDALGKSSFFQGLQGDKVPPKGVSFSDVERVHKEVKAGKPLSAKDTAIATLIGETPPSGSAKANPYDKSTKVPGLGQSQSQAERRAAEALGVSPAQAKANQKAFTTAPVPGTPGKAPGPAPLTKAQQLELALAKSPNDVALLKEKAAADDAAISFLQKRHAEGKVANATYIQEYTALYNDRNSTEATIASVTAKGVTSAKKAAAAAKAAAKTSAAIPLSLQIQQALASTTQDPTDDVKAAQAIDTYLKNLISSKHLKGQALLDALNEIGQVDQQLGQFAVPWKIQLDQAKAALTVSTADDIAAAKSLKAYAEQQLASRKLSHQGQLDALAAIGQADQTLGAAPTKSVKLVTGADVTKGLKLTRAQRLAVEQRYDQAQAHGGRRPTGVGVLGQTITINVNGATDADRVADKVIAKIQRKGQTHVNRSRGTNAGRGYMGDH